MPTNSNASGNAYNKTNSHTHRNINNVVILIVLILKAILVKTLCGLSFYVRFLALGRHQSVILLCTLTIETNKVVDGSYAKVREGASKLKA